MTDPHASTPGKDGIEAADGALGASDPVPAGDPGPSANPANPANPAAGEGDEAVVWFVVHTRSRCEKKLVEYCQRAGLETTLPVYRSVKKYRGKTVTFEKPLFPGYVFLKMLPASRSKVLQSDYTANVLDVPDQEEFRAQLGAILEALGTEYEVRLSPTIQPGARVRIRSGPLRGLEGFVEERRGLVEVHLRLDFIGQAAAVRMDADLLEVV